MILIENEQMVDELFKTKTRTFIKCLDVDFESGKDEYCLEIQLPVKSLSEYLYSYYYRTTRVLLFQTITHF